MNFPSFDLHELSQRLWLDVVARHLLVAPTTALETIDSASTGPTPAPAPAGRPTSPGHPLQAQAPDAAAWRPSGEGQVFDAAIQDLQATADRALASHQSSAGSEGWVSLDATALLASDAAGAVKVARELHQRAARRNLLIEIPATAEGMVAVEQALFLGIPVNVTLLFAREHCLAVAKAYMRALERRMAAGLSPAVPCFASQVITGWNIAVDGSAPGGLHNRLGMAVAIRNARAWHGQLDSARWQRLAESGARPPRLLWDDAGARHPSASILIAALSAAGTINAVPVAPLLASLKLGRSARPGSDRDGSVDPLVQGLLGDEIDKAAQVARLERQRVLAATVCWSEVLASSRHRLQPGGEST